MTQRLFFISGLLCTWIVLSLHPATAHAADPQPTDETASAEEESGIGLNLDLGYATHYVFRGLNVFMDDKLMDPHMLLAPGVTWSIADTGLAIGWWSAWQISGDNISENIDGGLGAEQDLYVTFEREISETVGIWAGVYWYFYPAAEEADSGARLPNYLEPQLGVYFSNAVDIGLDATWMIGLPDGFSVYNYIYLNPYVGREFEFNDRAGLAVKGGFGYKLFTDAPSEISDNQFDITLTGTLTIALGDHGYLSPLLGFCWTNLQSPEPGQPNPPFKKEIIVWGGLNVGADF